MQRNSRSGSPEPRADQDKGDQKNGKSPRNSRSNSPRRSAERRERSRSPSMGPKGTVLYVGNLTRRCDETDIREAFEKYGRLADINIIKDPYTNECRGFAFLKYENDNDATDALALDNTEIDGRKIRVEKSKRDRGHAKTPGEYLGHEKGRGQGRGGRGGRRSPSPYRRRSPRKDRYSRDERSDRRYRDHDRDRRRSRSGGRYRSKSRDRSGSYNRRRR